MKKGIGDKVLGWFVVQEGDEADAPADEGEERAAGSPASPVTVATASPSRASARANVPAQAAHDASKTSPPLGRAPEAGAFAAVYRAAGVSDEERDRLAKVLALVESLPDEASIDVKRSIVSASLGAFGISIDRILVTGDGALAALDGHVASGQTRTKEVLAQGEARIAELTAEIEDVRRLMSVQVAALQELSRAAAAEKARIGAAVDFFEGSGGAPGVQALHGPRLVRLK